MKNPVVVIGAALVVTAFVIFVGLRGGPSSGESTIDADAFGIPVQDAALVADGEALYQTHCGSCHAFNLRGTGAGSSLLSVAYEPGALPDDAIVDAIRNGVPQRLWDLGAMPAVVGPSDEDLDRMIAYIREAQRTEGFERYPPG